MAEHSRRVVQLPTSKLDETFFAVPDITTGTITYGKID